MVKLTKREREYLTLWCDGLGRKEIVEQMHISIHTINTYHAHISTKFRNFTNIYPMDAVNLFRLAIEFGLVEPPRYGGKLRLQAKTA